MATPPTYLGGFFKILHFASEKTFRVIYVLFLSVYEIECWLLSFHCDLVFFTWFRFKPNSSPYAHDYSKALLFETQEKGFGSQVFEKF